MSNLWRAASAAAVITFLLASPGPQFAAEEFRDKKLDAEKPEEAERAVYNSVLRGQRKAEDHRELVEKMLKWHLYRLTWQDVQRNTIVIKTRPGDVRGKEYPYIFVVMQEALESRESDSESVHYYQLFPVPGVKPTEPETLQVYNQRVANLQYIAKAAIPHLRELMKQGVAVRVNAMRVYHRLAELGVAAVAPELEACVNNGRESNGVKHYALKGFGELFARQHADPSFLDKQDHHRYVALVHAFLLYHADLRPEVLSQMSEEEKEAVSFVRRTAIIALANTRLAMIEGPNKQPLRLGEIYHQIMSADPKLRPAPSTRERVEAARAIIMIKAVKGYEPDYAAHELGKFISFLGGECNKGVKEPWLFYGRYLSEPFRSEAGPPNLKHLGDSRFCQDATAKFLDVLQHLETQLKMGAVNALDNWLSDNRPPVDRLYTEGG